MKVLAFAASSSKKSINKLLVTFAANLLKDAQVEVIDLNDYELPLFSVDKEEEIGQPKLAKDFLNKIAESDAVIISFAEHNGSFAAAYKNLFDWCTRINKNVFQKKPLVLLSASPGPGGGANVLAAAKTSAPFFSGEVKSSLSIPNFYENFNLEEKILKNKGMKAQLQSAVSKLIT